MPAHPALERQSEASDSGGYYQFIDVWWCECEFKQCFGSLDDKTEWVPGDDDEYGDANDERFSDATTAPLVTYFGRLHLPATAIAI